MAQDPYRYFRIEAREILDQLGKASLDLEKSPAPGLVALLLRLAHTLKGAARVVKQAEIADQTHAIEEILAPLRDATSPVPRQRIDAVLALLDDISRRVAALTAPPDHASATPGQLRAEESPRTVPADAAEMDKLLDGVGEVQAQLGSLRKSLVMVERAGHLVELLSDQVTAPRNREALRMGNAVVAERICSLAEEMKTLAGGSERGLASDIERIERELAQVRGAAERLRLLPAGSLFTALERTARDAAQELGKRIDFVGRGGDVRLDAQLLGAIQGALVQVVRNAVAHGIEAETERRAVGKPAAGCVTIAVARRGRHIVFTGADDGRGVDLEAVRSAMQRKGPPALDTQRLGPEELLRLLLKGGISTSSTVSEVSGRGIGLDVVRTTVERLGGEVSVRTVPGQGTQVELTVPSSLAVVETLIIEVAGAAVAIPRDAVLRTLRIAAPDIIRTAGSEAVVYDGKVVAFVPLSRVLSDRPEPVHGIRPWSAVVVQAGDRIAAIGVDRLLGTANVLVRPLPQLALAGAVVAGAWLDRNGDPQLVLDPDVLVAEAVRCLASEPPPAAPHLRVLVIDDSLTTRMLEQSILESAGYDVDTATSGEEALEKALRQRYALFLVDVEMPGMDGFTFIERIRSAPELRGIPSILVTSRASPEDRSRGQQVGADAYIVKSEFDQGDLLARIRTLVG